MRKPTPPGLIVKETDQTKVSEWKRGWCLASDRCRISPCRCFARPTLTAASTEELRYRPEMEPMARALMGWRGHDEVETGAAAWPSAPCTRHDGHATWPLDGRVVR